jgi:hypothetical protein
MALERCNSLFDFIKVTVKQANMRGGFFKSNSLICYFFEEAKKLNLLDDLLVELIIDSLQESLLCWNDRAMQVSLFNFVFDGPTLVERERAKLFNNISEYVEYKEECMRLDF